MSSKWWILATAVILELVEIELLLNRQKRRFIATLLYAQDKNRAFVNVAVARFLVRPQPELRKPCPAAPMVRHPHHVLELLTSILICRLALSSAHCVFRSPIDA
jgi:hypothetical protein